MADAAELQAQLVALQEQLAKRDEQIAILTRNRIAEGEPPSAGESLARQQSVAKYTGLLSSEGISESDRTLVQRIQSQRAEGLALSDFSAEDRAAWQALDQQWRDSQANDGAIAAAAAAIEDEEELRAEAAVSEMLVVESGGEDLPRSEGVTQAAALGLSRTVSVAKYDVMLQSRKLPEEQRAKVEAMRAKRMAHALDTFTDEEREEWEYLERLAQGMAEADAEIARVLAEPSAEEAAAAQAAPSATELGLSEAEVAEHAAVEEQLAGQLAEQLASAAMAAALDGESIADEVANGGAAAGEGEGGTIPAGVTEELAAEHAEQSQARREADAIFAMDATVAAAENREVDFELSSKTAAHTAQDPALKPGGGGGGSGGVSSADCLVVATAVSAEVTADLVPMDELIQVTARAAGIPEEGLRQYIEDTKANQLIRTTSRELGVPEAELAALVARHAPKLQTASDAHEDTPEPEPEC